MEQTFRIGEWVIFTNHLLDGYGGFVTKYDESDDTYFVEVTSKPNGTSTRGHFWVEGDQLIGDENIDLDEIQITNLLDIALDTKDQEWFMELSAQLNLSTRM